MGDLKVSAWPAWPPLLPLSPRSQAWRGGSAVIAARIPGRLQHFFVSSRAAYIAPCLSRRVNSRAKSDPRAGGVSQDLQHLHPPCRPAPPFPWPPEPVPIEHHEAAPSSLVLSGHRRSFTALASPRSSAWEEPCNGPSPFAQRRTQADEKKRCPSLRGGARSSNSRGFAHPRQPTRTRCP